MIVASLFRRLVSLPNVSADQYVLPGTILYKQRGTLWYAGENAILGRDHTIHAAVAGYVKYYRDPYQHPHRQYIGVTLDRSDALPHAPDAARKRRLGMVAVRRKTAPAPEPRTPGGLPRRVIRRAGVREAMDAAAEEPTRAAAAAAASEEAVQAAEDAAAASAPSATSPPAKGTGKGKETKAARAARRWNAYIRIKRSNRVLFVTKNYAYRESNVQIGQLMGRNNGTRRYGSRHAVLRHRRAKRDEALRQAKELMRQQRALAGDKTAKNAGGKKKTKAAKKDKAAKGKKKAA